MQVAVAGVKNVHAAQPVALLHLPDRFEHLTDVFARNGAIHAVVVRREPAGSREGILAAGPEQQPLGLRARDAQCPGAGGAQHGLDFLHLFAHLLRRAIRFHQQDGCCLEVIARVHEGLDGSARLAVHHLERGRDDSGGDDGGDCIAGALHVGEGGHDELGTRRSRNELHGHLGDDQQQSLRADGEGKQIQPRAVGSEAAELDARAVHRVAAKPEHVVEGEPVLEAMHAAGVLCDIAADRAGDLRGRIGRVIQSEACGGFGDLEVRHPGLEAGDAIDRVDLEHPAHACA